MPIPITQTNLSRNWRNDSPPTMDDKRLYELPLADKLDTKLDSVRDRLNRELSELLITMDNLKKSAAGTGTSTITMPTEKNPLHMELMKGHTPKLESTCSHFQPLNCDNANRSESSFAEKDNDRQSLKRRKEDYVHVSDSSSLINKETLQVKTQEPPLRKRRRYSRRNSATAAMLIAGFGGVRNH
jgi:hypothetical protein